MRKPLYQNRLLHLLAALILMFFILSLSVTFALNFRPLYYFDINHLGIPESSGYSEEEIRANYDTLIDYNSVFYRGDLELPTLPSSENGLTHFAEVKVIFDLVQVLAAVTFVLSVLAVIYFVRHQSYHFLYGAGALTLILPSVIGVLIAVNWDSFFETFHHIFFNNDFWLFVPSEDPVITILPDEFFLHAAVLILVCVVVGSLLCFLSGILLSRHSRKRARETGQRDDQRQHS